MTFRLYFDFWLVIAGLLAPIYFLAEIPKHTRTYEPEHYPNVLQVLFVYILIPLFSVYTIILYAYFAKIISTQTWPIGLVGHLVLWYAVFSAILIFCQYGGPASERAQSRRPHCRISPNPDYHGPK